MTFCVVCCIYFDIISLVKAEGTANTNEGNEIEEQKIYFLKIRKWEIISLSILPSTVISYIYIYMCVCVCVCVSVLCKS